jgi:predicted nucleotide-binding protein
MKEKIIAELNKLLSSRESSTSTILNKAVQLAAICNEENYRLLFTYHLEGISNAFAEQLYEKNQIVSNLFSSDRMKTGENKYLIGSLVSIERRLENIKIDINRQIKALENLKPIDWSADYAKRMTQSAERGAISSVINELRKQETQNEEVINKIRNRVATFVGQIEIKLLNDISNKVGDKNMQLATDKRKVFVVHGRNSKARKALFSFLRSIGLHPLEWSQAVELTGKTSPYVGEILEAGFLFAQAAIVLFTPDDVAMLREEFRGEKEPIYETELTGQARPNVIFEAGMAMGLYPDRTILVELGELRPISDISGRHVIRLNNTIAKRQELANRLKISGCSVNLTGDDWHEEGNFEIPILTKTMIQVSKVKEEHNKVSSVELDDDEIQILEFLSEKESSYFDDLQTELNHLRPAYLKHYLNHLSDLDFIKKLETSVAKTIYSIKPKGLEYLVENDLL